jgi:ABC-type glycerol-3-phosphate transport system substrate-binding protein
VRKQVTAALLAAGLVLSGCGRDGATGDDKATDVDTGKVSGAITVWAQGSEGEQLGAFAKGFEAANPGVTVNVTPMGRATPTSGRSGATSAARRTGRTPGSGGGCTPPTHWRSSPLLSACGRRASR